MLHTICDLLKDEQSTVKQLLTLRDFLSLCVEQKAMYRSKALYIYTQFTTFLYVLGDLSLEDMLAANGVATSHFKFPT